jgi:hypothetical protein
MVKFTPGVRANKAADNLVAAQKLFRYALTLWLVEELDNAFRGNDIANEIINELGLKYPYTVIEEAERRIMEEKKRVLDEAIKKAEVNQ